MLTGILIKITHKDGRVTEINVADDAKIEITTNDRRMGTPARPSHGDDTAKTNKDKTGKSAHPTDNDPDRAAAEWVLAQKPPTKLGYFFAQVTVQLKCYGEIKNIVPGQPLPDEPFKVTQIGLVTATITDEELATHLPELSALWRLELAHCPGITDASLPTLRMLAGLRFLSVAGTSLSPQVCLELIQSLPVEHVGVAPRQANPELLDFVCATPRIKSFGFNSSAGNPNVGIVSDAQIQALFRTQHLTALVLVLYSELKFSTWQAVLDNLPSLTSLHAQGKSITDAHVAEFARFPKLTKLEVMNTSITDAGLPALRDCPTLRHLDLTGTPVTAASLATLHTTLPNCRILHSGGVIE